MPRKLGPQEAQEIRESDLPRRLLAEIYGVHRKTIGDIRSGRTQKRFGKDGRRLLDGPICLIENCGRPREARGWCRRHYKRWLKTGSTDGRDRNRQPERCLIEDCPDPPTGRGWCSRHYQRWQKNGHPLRLTRVEAAEARAADENGIWRCPNGHRVNPENTFYHADRPGSLKACRICYREKHREHYRKNPEKHREHARSYNNRNRALVSAKARLRLRDPELRDYIKEKKRRDRARLDAMFPPTRLRAPWTPDEDAIVMRDDISDVERLALLRRNGTPRSHTQMRGRRQALRAGWIPKGQPLVHGEHNPAAKLTENDVREIRASNLTGVELARIYAVSQSMISSIRRRRSWTYLT